MPWYTDYLPKFIKPKEKVQTANTPPSGSYAATHPMALSLWNALNTSVSSTNVETDLMKAILERRPSRAIENTVGIPDIGFKGARQQLFQRLHLLELYAIAHNNSVLKTATGNLKQEVFRRGFKWEPAFAYQDIETGKDYTVEEIKDLTDKLAERKAEAKKLKREPLVNEDDLFKRFRNPNIRQREHFEEIMRCSNIYDQSLLELLHELEDDLNISDDAFLFLSSEYTFDWNYNRDMITREVKQLYRLDPVFVEYDLDSENRPGFAHHVCLLHREDLLQIPPGENWHIDWRGVCPIDGHTTFPVIYRYTPKRGTFGAHVGVSPPDREALYLVKGEVIHISKFSPSELYGYSPILSIYEKVLSLVGMDRYLYDYFFERQMPQGIVTTVTDNPEDLEARKDQVLSETLNNPHYIPWLAVSSKTGQGRTEFVRFAYSLDELQFLPVQEHIEKAVAALFGVPDLFMGSDNSSGGLNNESQQVVRLSRGARLSQSIYNTSFFPALLSAFGITDWTLELETAEEQSEQFEIEMKQRRAQWAQTMVTMGFGAKYTQDTDEYEITGEVLSAQEQQETQAGGGMMGGMDMGGGGEMDVSALQNPGSESFGAQDQLGAELTEGIEGSTGPTGPI